MKHNGNRTSMSGYELAKFAARWPCYDGPALGGWAEFASNGDLVEMSAGWARHRESSALTAIIEDMKNARAMLAGVQAEGN